MILKACQGNYSGSRLVLCWLLEMSVREICHFLYTDALSSQHNTGVNLLSLGVEKAVIIQAMRKEQLWLALGNHLSLLLAPHRLRQFPTGELNPKRQIAHSL